MLAQPAPEGGCTALLCAYNEQIGLFHLVVSLNTLAEDRGRDLLVLFKVSPARPI